MPKNRKNPRIATTAIHAGEASPFAYTPDEGRKALTLLRATLDAIPEEEVEVIRIDVEAAAYAALGVARFVQSAEVRPRFAELPRRAFDMTNADELAPLGLVTLFLLTEAQATGALATEAKIAPQIAAEMAQVESRMQTVCEYHLWDDAEIGPELERLRPGIGYRDLLNDVKGYIRIYELRAEVVKTDSKNYRPTDLKRAKELAAIFGLAFSEAMSPKAREAYTDLLRAWTLLQRRYAEVREAGLWLFRKDSSRDKRFPTLFAASRPTPGRPRKQLVDAAQPAPAPAAAEPVPGAAPTKP